MKTSLLGELDDFNPSLSLTPTKNLKLRIYKTFTDIVW